MCDHEILELFLFDAVPRHNTNPVAHALLDRFGSLLGVFAADKSELMKISGVGEGVAAYIKDTFDEQCGRLQSALRSGKTIGKGQIRNYMIWQRMNAEAAERKNDVTVVITDSEGRFADGYNVHESDVEKLLEEVSENGAGVLLAYSADTDIAENILSSSSLVGVFRVDGTEVTDARAKHTAEQTK